MINNNPGMPRFQPGGGGDPTLSNPGFFELAAFPGAPAIIPEAILPMEVPKVSKNAQKNYLENIMKNFMESSKQLQKSFAFYLGGVPPKGK